MIGQVEPIADPIAKRISPAFSDTPPLLFCGPFLFFGRCVPHRVTKSPRRGADIKTF